MSDIPHVPGSVSRKLGHYVYLYTNPLTGAIFYVGKGRGSRATTHLKGASKRKVQVQIRAIRAAGARPRVEILAHNLPSEAMALAMETAAIELLGLDNLANSVRGHHARLSRFAVEDLVAHYTKDQVRIKEPTLLIRVNRLYRPGMSAGELYDITRSAWKVGPQREEVQLVCAVFESVIREVYRPTKWLPAVSTFNQRWQGRQVRRPGRWEFVGVIGEERIRKRYLGKFVGHEFKAGNQNPVAYLNCDM